MSVDRIATIDGLFRLQCRLVALECALDGTSLTRPEREAVFLMIDDARTELDAVLTVLDADQGAVAQ